MFYLKISHAVCPTPGPNHSICHFNFPETKLLLSLLVINISAGVGWGVVHASMVLRHNIYTLNV